MTENEKTLLEFPCDFPIKIVGNNNKSFQQEVIAIMQKHVKNFNSDGIKVLPSQGNKYLSMTICITATSKEQLDSLYQDLNACKDVVMTL